MKTVYTIRLWLDTYLSMHNSLEDPIDDRINAEINWFEENGVRPNVKLRDQAVQYRFPMNDQIAVAHKLRFEQPVGTATKHGFIYTVRRLFGLGR